MDWQLTPFAFIYLVTAMVAASVAWLARKRRSTPGARALAGLMVAATIWTLADGLERMTSDLQTKIVLAKISHLGIQAVAPLFLIFVLRYTHRDHWLTPARMVALWTIPVLALCAATSNEFHRLFWSEVQLVELAYGMESIYIHGPLFWVAAVYAYSLLAIGTILLVRSILRYRDVYRRQASVLVAATLVPWFGNIAYLSSFNPLPGLDYTSIAFVITGVLVAYGIFYLGLLDLAPVARNTLFERMSDALLVTDSQARVVDANPAAYELLRGRGELIGAPLEMALGNVATADLLLDGGAEVHSVITLEDTGSHGMDALCTPLYDEKGKVNGRLIVLRDISDRLRMEQELRRSEEHYRNFLATVSHELRTPLTGILGMAEALQAYVYGPLTERQLRSLQIIEQSGRHLTSVINDMLDLSRIESGTLNLRVGPCGVADLVATSAAAVREAAEAKQQTIQIAVDPPGLQVTADPQRLTQVLVHLLNNAVKFTPAGGAIGIDAHSAHSDDGSYGGETLFVVWDTGIGIAPDEQAQLFQPFTQVDARLSRRYGGVGLGLALVRSLVELHGGQVRLESTPGHGSRFIVQIPRSAPMPGSAPAAAQLSRAAW